MSVEYGFSESLMMGAGAGGAFDAGFAGADAQRGLDRGHDRGLDRDLCLGQVWRTDVHDLEYVLFRSLAPFGPGRSRRPPPALRARARTLKCPNAAVGYNNI